MPFISNLPGSKQLFKDMINESLVFNPIYLNKYLRFILAKK